jgi:hypothetical protein
MFLGNVGTHTSDYMRRNPEYCKENIRRRENSDFLYSFFALVGSTALLLGDQPVARPLPTHRTTQKQNKLTQTSMPPVGFKPTISVLEREKFMPQTARPL